MSWQKDSDRRVRNLAAVIALGLLPAIAGTIVFLLVVIVPTWQLLSTLHWQPITCTVTHAEVSSGQSSDHYRAELRYRYTFEGEVYESDRYRFIRIRTSDRSHWQKVVDAYPVGSKQTCYVNPEHPEQATLKRFYFGLHWLIPLPFMALGYGVLYAAKTGRIKAGLHGRPAEWRPRSLISGHGPGPITLSPRRGRIKALIKIACAAILWNCLNAMIIQNAIAGGAISILQASAVLVLGSFGLIGIVLLYKTLRALVRIASPSIEIELERGLLPVGGSAWLRCRMPGRPSHDHEITLRLYAQELAYLRSSRGVQKHRAMLYEQLLSVDRGKALLSIQADAMHSLDAEHNKVVWTLEVTAALRGWSDIRDRYPLTVVPMPIHRAPPIETAHEETEKESPLTIQLDQMDADYEPGETIAGEVLWDLDGMADEITVRLLWITSGRSKTDTGFAGEQSLVCALQQGKTRFELPGVLGPYSFHGELFKLDWWIEVTENSTGEKSQQKITIAPSRRAVHPAHEQTDRGT